MRIKRCKEAIKHDFEILSSQTAVEALVDKPEKAQDCEDNKLICDKINTLRKKYEKAKGDFVGVIEAFVHQSKLNLLQEKTMVQEIWLTLQKEFDIIRALGIGVIVILVMGKLFQDHESVDSYCQAYQNAYNEIVSRLINKNGNYRQDKYYEVLLQGAMLERLLEDYVLLVATLDTKWASYTHANLRKTIYRISWYLNIDLFKVLHKTSVPRLLHSNKHPRLTSNTEISVCLYPICKAKSYYHPIETCWKLHLKLQPANRRVKAKQAELNIRGTISSDNTKNKTS